MDIEKLIEQLNGYFEGKTLTRGAALDSATALSTLQAENEKLRAEVEQERAHRIHAEQHADAFQKGCERINAELERVTAERDKAVEDIWVAKWISCKYGESCDFISARTGVPDCAGCGDWEWRGIEED